MYQKYQSGISKIKSSQRLVLDFEVVAFAKAFKEKEGYIWLELKQVL